MEGQKCGIGRKPPTTLVEDGQMKSTSRWPFVVNVPSKLRTEVYSAGIGDYSLQRSHQDEPIFLFCWVGNWITGRHGSRGGDHGWFQQESAVGFARWHRSRGFLNRRERKDPAIRTRARAHVHAGRDGSVRGDARVRGVGQRFLQPPARRRPQRPARRGRVSLPRRRSTTRGWKVVDVCRSGPLGATEENIRIVRGFWFPRER